MTWARFMGLWTRLLVVVYRVYHGPAKMEGGVVCRSSAHGGSRMRELDIAGERERERERTRFCSWVTGRKNWASDGGEHRWAAHLIGSGVQARRRIDRAVLGLVGNDRCDAPFIGWMVREEAVGVVVQHKWWWDASNHLVTGGEEWNGWTPWF
jgi:hypothetical protein